MHPFIVLPLNGRKKPIFINLARIKVYIFTGHDIPVFGDIKNKLYIFGKKWIFLKPELCLTGI